MEPKLWGLLPGESLLQWLLLLFLLGLFIYREWPGFWERVSRKIQREARIEQADRSLSDRLDQIEADVKEIKEKLGRDYTRMNTLEDQQEKEHKAVQSMIKEQAIIMRALLGTLKGLQELGANGPTKEAQAEIVEYLNNQAHDGGN